MLLLLLTAHSSQLKRHGQLSCSPVKNANITVLYKHSIKNQLTSVSVTSLNTQALLQPRDYKNCKTNILLFHDVGHYMYVDGGPVHTGLILVSKRMDSTDGQGQGSLTLITCAWSLNLY